MHPINKFLLISSILLMCILATSLGLDKISAANSPLPSFIINEDQLIAKGGGHHGGHHHHHHHHHHGHHHHHHHHGHHHHGWHHGWHNGYWYGGSGGIWGDNPGYLYDPNFYYDVNGTPSVPYNALYNETPLIPGAQGQGTKIENNTLIQNLPVIKNEAKKP